ncbi:MAG: 23S rRNA (adenine(2503)-C(2))-methyltransferase RlmN [Desulfurispora sp.]|uniref:23S rRNA (adenine(2503)-C(2))-methyltransferase RlmN n=1 Tax=Desulfurispora sp. TaxID=3014275 RepID=UPI00404AF18D
MLLDYHPEQLTELMRSMGQPDYRARQLAAWLFQKMAAGFEEMRDLPLSLRRSLQEVAVVGQPVVVYRQVSSQREAEKFLLQYPDGQRVECVLMTYRHGRSLCVSTQAGCRMGCRLCASTLGGLARNLSAGEIFGQLAAVTREKQLPVTHLVLMGSGEPLDNLEQVERFLLLVTSEFGPQISWRRITVSTCGLVPGILALARRGWPLTLAVSLHAPDDQLRSQLMPVNKKYPLPELMGACREYVRSTGRRITFEYTLLAGVNDTPAHAAALVRLLKGLLCHVNLIPYNEVPERPFKRSRRMQEFCRSLKLGGVPATVRRSLGGDIDAACGQLRRRGPR